MDNQDLRISEPTPASSSRSHRKSRKLEDERHNDDIEKEIEEPVGGSIRSASTTSGGVRKGRTKRKRIEQNHRKVRRDKTDNETAADCMLSYVFNTVYCRK